MDAVRFDNVVKSFPRYAGHLLLRERLAHLFSQNRRESFQALKGVSFTLRPGESLGVIGHNGAGKSTLLNLMTGLCLPTSGTVTVSGRIAALLDLGSGFHPDLTGAENIQINAALLGITRKQTKAHFDAIVDFAGIGESIYEPLRTYSAGMVMRLAFAVASHVDPDILIIDEVLGVGDQAFVEKCVDRIDRFRRAGKTLICVSHSLSLISSLCDRTIWLDHGTIARDGITLDILHAYGCAVRGEPAPA